MTKLNNYLLNEFKVIYREAIQKSHCLKFEELLGRLCSYNNLSKEEILNIEELKSWFMKIYHQSYIDYLLKLYDAHEIIIHSIEDIEIIGAESKKLKVEFLSKDDFELSIHSYIQRKDIEWNFSTPFASFADKRLEKDLRVSITHPSVSPIASSKVFIRIHNDHIFNIEGFSADSKVSEIINTLVANKSNFIVSGSTGSGKTSFLNTCKSMASNEEHHVVIEDVTEIKGCVSNTTHLLASPSSGKSLKDYCKYALRISPKRIFLGEIRSDEVIPFILAMNTGHKGMMTTVHANNAIDTLKRLATLFSIYSDGSTGIDYKQVLKLICQSVNHVVFMENKEITEIIEVHGCEEGVPITSMIFEKSFHSKKKSAQYDLAC